MKNEDIKIKTIDVMRLYERKISWLLRMYNGKYNDCFSGENVLNAMTKIQQVIYDILGYETYDSESQDDDCDYLRLDFDDFLDKYRDLINVNDGKGRLASDAVFEYLYELNELIAPKTLNDCSEYLRTMDEDKAKQFNDMYGKYTKYVWKASDEYIVYRNVEFPLDDYGAFYVDGKEGKPHAFQLIWDWWYPIERYLFLERDVADEEEKD